MDQETDSWSGGEAQVSSPKEHKIKELLQATLRPAVRGRDANFVPCLLGRLSLAHDALLRRISTASVPVGPFVPAAFALAGKILQPKDRLADYALQVVRLQQGKSVEFP
ncbi:MAG: hypothetical protein Q9211_004390 [Gyalolechia sp. 1 TL-2023]